MKTKRKMAIMTALEIPRKIRADWLVHERQVQKTIALDGALAAHEHS